MNLFKRIPRTPEEKQKLRSERFMIVLSGVLMGFAYPPFPFPITAFIALVPLLYVVTRREKLIDLNRAAYLFGFVTGLVSLYWVGAYTVGKDPFLMIGGGLMLFANPIFFIIPTTLYYALSRSKFIGKEKAIWFLPPFWAFYEYFYMNIDLNFPWITLSNSMANFPVFYKISDIIGALGVTMLLLYINIFLFRIWEKWRTEKKTDRMALRILNVLILVPLFYGIITRDDQPAQETLRTGLVQPNLDPYEKWAGGNLDDILNKYFTLSDKAVKEGAQIIIWPETALPVYLMNGQYDAQVQRIYSYADSNKVYILTGMPHIKMFQPGDKLPSDVKSYKGSDIKYATYNSVLLFAPGDRTVQQYGKVKLVPFGERTPYIDQLPFLGNVLQWGVGLSSWNVGQESMVFSANVKTSTGKREVKFGALVCFESVFPNFVTEFSQKGAEFFAVVTNDSWYGNTSGPYQHKEFSTLRALENHRAFVRAANGGISCLIDQSGTTQTATRMYETAVITVDVPLLKRSTLFMNSAFVVPYLTILLSVIAVLLWIYQVIIEKKNKTEKRG